MGPNKLLYAEYGKRDKLIRKEWVERDSKGNLTHSPCTENDDEIRLLAYHKDVASLKVQGKRTMWVSYNGNRLTPPRLETFEENCRAAFEYLDSCESIMIPMVHEADTYHTERYSVYRGYRRWELKYEDSQYSLDKLVEKTPYSLHLKHDKATHTMNIALKLNHEVISEINMEYKHAFEPSDGDIRHITQKMCDYLEYVDLLKDFSDNYPIIITAKEHEEKVRRAYLYKMSPSLELEQVGRLTHRQEQTIEANRDTLIITITGTDTGYTVHYGSMIDGKYIFGDRVEGPDFKALVESIKMNAALEITEQAEETHGSQERIFSPKADRVVVEALKRNPLFKNGKIKERERDIGLDI